MITGALPRLIGAGIEVPLADGSMRRYVNLDCAASTPALEPVVQRRHGGAALVQQRSPRRRSPLPGVDAPLRGRSPVRGRASSARGTAIRSSSSATPRTRSTTSRPACACPRGQRCWPRRWSTTPTCCRGAGSGRSRTCRRRRSEAALLESLEDALRDGAGRIAVVAVTGASNVTGEVMPVAAMARLAHAHGALISVDAAQLAPHRAIDMAAMDVDCLAFSGHKMYAPFGAGALVVRTDLVGDAEPLLAGRRRRRLRHRRRRALDGYARPPRGGQPQRHRRGGARRGREHALQRGHGRGRRARAGAARAGGGRVAPDPSRAAAAPLGRTRGRPSRGGDVHRRGHAPRARRRRAERRARHRRSPRLLLRAPVHHPPPRDRRRGRGLGAQLAAPR